MTTRACAQGLLLFWSGVIFPLLGGCADGELEDGQADATADTGSGEGSGGEADNDAEGDVDASFRLREDVRDDRAEAVVTIDVYDADVDEVLTSWDIGRRGFASGDDWYDVTLRAGLAGRDGHRIETRAFWHDRANVRIDVVLIRFD
jgi:hypothetical protein